jgi:hypothetical protein
MTKGKRWWLRLHEKGGKELQESHSRGSGKGVEHHTATRKGVEHHTATLPYLHCQSCERERALIRLYF